MQSKKHFLTTAALVVAAMFIVDAAMAETGTYMSISNGDWDNPNIWKVDTNNNGTYDVDPATAKPTEDNRVQIGHRVNVTGDEAADTLDVSSAGILDIELGNTLILDNDDDPTNDSLIDGTVNLEGAGSRLLFIDTNHTIDFTSTKGTIAGASDTARIEIGAGNPTVTNKVNIEGALEIRAGAGTFRNGSTGVVNANREATPWKLTIYSGTFDGTGTYEVSTNSSAVLLFRAGITANGLTGPFTVSNGTLDIRDDDVKTEGHLTLSGSGKIDVDDTAKFTANFTPE